MNKTIGFVSLGCAKNAVDLEVMAGHLVKRGFKLASGPDRADVLIVNTCAFIESAREEAAAEIMRACSLKASGAVGAVIVTGCFPQRYGRKTLELFPGVDAIAGIDQLDEIAAIAANPAKTRFRQSCRRVFEPPVPALRFTGKAFAYLKIAEGCAHRCTYCAIPGIRGKYRSRPAGAIVREAKALLATGVRELVVIAQDPMLWGVDLKGRRLRLVDLLKRLDRLPGEFWIRVLYSYPSEIDEAFLGWLASSPHACRYVDVPLQHTDPAVLRAMGRAAAIEASLSAAERIRAAVPGVTLRTTVMTGFPGETRAAFQRLVADVKRMKFDHLGAFAFSPEDGTAASAMEGRPSRRVAEAREREVMEVQRRVWAAKARKLKGTLARALVVAPGVARLESQAPDVDGVTLLDCDSARVGEFVDVRIVGTRGYDLKAHLA